MSPPTQEGSGEAILVIARSACANTSVVAVLVLLPVFGSAVVVAAVTVFVSVVLFGVFRLTFNTMVKVAVSPAATVIFVNVIVPVPPTGGVVLVHPFPATEIDTKVVFGGIGSVTVTDCASD